MDTKPCRKCGIVKPIFDFSVHKKMPNGRLHTCKTCRNIYLKEYRQTPAGKAARQKEKQYPEIKKRYKQSDKGKIASAKYRPSKERMAAKNAVRYALRTGKILKQPCFVCGENAAAHHSSYAPEMRLVVTWLCTRHHNDLHIEHNGYKSWL